jgi:putative membrane protein
LLAVVLLAPASALGQDRTWEWQWGMHPMMFIWGAGGLVMMLMMLVFWGLVIAGLVLGVRWLAGQGRGEGRGEALEILRQRRRLRRTLGRAPGWAQLNEGVPFVHLEDRAIAATADPMWPTPRHRT